MRIYEDESLRYFDFWGQAADNVNELTEAELDTVEAILEDSAPEEGYDKTYINDLFAYDFDTVLEWLGKVYFGDTLYDESDVSDMTIDDIIEEYKDELSESDFTDIYRYVILQDPDVEEDYDNGEEMLDDENGFAIDEFLEILKNKEIIDFEVITDGYEYKIVDLR
jgi:hypothetical protein